MSRAWCFQDSRQKRKLGIKAPWSVGWLDPEGKRRSKRIGSKSMADKFRRKVEGEMAAGTYQNQSRKKWSEFRQEYESRILPTLSAGSTKETRNSLNHFERVVKPVRVSAIRTATIDQYVAARRTERGLKKGSQVSVATVNKELRHLKAVLRIGHEWGYLQQVPRFRMLREPAKLVRYVTPEHFAAMFQACDSARMPTGLPYPSSDWWRAVLIFAYMTGWRIGEILALRRDDLDMDAGTAVTRASDNKGKRDERVPLHPVVVERLESIQSFEPLVFPWYHGEPTLWREFRRLQRLAAIHLPCEEEHEHTDACHAYGFHDLRRAFATQNAMALSSASLQTLMRHKSYQTTQRYINMARQLDGAVEKLHVPELPHRQVN